MTSLASINTVLGPIDPSALGFTLMHEHVLVAASGLYQSYPDLLGRGPEARAIEALKPRRRPASTPSSTPPRSTSGGTHHCWPRFRRRRA